MQKLEEPEEALAYARARVTIDPFAEAGHLAVVRLLGRLRRVREGIEQYDACREILAGVGGRPSQAMERARLALTTATAPESVPRPHPSAAPAPLRPAATAPPLVGRGREAAVIGEAVALVMAARRRRGVLVLGEPGIGKSRLLDEVADLAGAAGFLVLRGRGFEAEALRPFGPWIDALRGAPLDTLPEVQRVELAPLVPELGAANPSTDQTRLFDAVVRALVTLARQNPILIVLDDVHWLDDTSAALLHYAFRALDGSPVLFACAARAGELADNALALSATRSLRRDDRVVRIDLEPLRSEEIAELVRSVEPSVDAARVFGESEGNPLFALLVARALRGGAEAGRSMDALFEERLAALSGAVRDVVACAAALGRGFRADLLARVSGRGTGELIAALADLERHGVVRPSGAGWDFAHDLYRRAAYAGVSEPRRRLLHAEIARALASLPDPDGSLAGEVARHAALGEEAHLAAQAAVTAGARAVRLVAVAEANDIVERGLRLAERLDAPQRIPVSLALLRVLVDASRVLGGDPGLAARIEALIEEARREDLPAEVAAGYAILSHAHFANRDLVHTAAATDDVVTALRDVPPSEAAVAMAETGGCLAILERDIPRARMLLAEARRCGALSARAAVYLETGTGLIHYLDGADEHALTSLERAARLAPDGAPWEECVILGWLAFIDLQAGRLERVAARTARMHAVGPRFGATGDVLLADALDLAARRVAGAPVSDTDLDAVLARLEREAKAYFARVACVIAERDIAAGRIAATTEQLLERACAAATAVARPSLVVLARALLARCELARGHGDAAWSQVQAARRQLDASAPMARAVRLLESVAQDVEARAEPLTASPGT